MSGFTFAHPYASRPSSPTNGNRNQRIPPRSQSTGGMRRDTTQTRNSNVSRGESPHRTRTNSPAFGPPSYAAPPLEMNSPRSPRTPLLGLSDGETNPNVPLPILLRSNSPTQGLSNRGQLKIHIPAWGLVLIKPPTRSVMQFLEDENSNNLPTDDTVLSGTLEVIMKERKRCQSIHVGVQSVCRLYMGARGWEEDGIFERGIEVLGGQEEGIWLEKGSQSFTFSILLPATLAVHDRHQFGRVSYIITATVEGCQSTSGLFSFFKPTPPKQENVHMGDIHTKEDFDLVIARSEKVNQDLAIQRTNSIGSIGSPRGISPQLPNVTLPGSPLLDDSALALDGYEAASPSCGGLYHRRLSSDFERVPPMSLSGSKLADDGGSIHTPANVNDPKGDKASWLKGDLRSVRSLLVHANPSPTGGVTQLDLRKEGRVDHLGPWRFTATSDVFSISGVVLFSFNLPSPSPLTTIFFIRVLLVQDYALVSPRRPNEAPHRPESPKNHVLYQTGRPHRSHERNPGHDLESLWRGTEAGGIGLSENEETGWTAKAVARLPNHDKIRPSTNPGTITPIRVSHDMVWQVFYSVEGETVSGKPIAGPGELRMMAVKMPICVPSCCCTASATSLPTYECAGDVPDIDAIISSPPDSKMCQCGYTFAELGEAAMRRMKLQDQEEAEARMREACGSSGLEDGMGNLKLEMERGASSSSPR